MNLYKEGDRCYGFNFSGVNIKYNYAICTIEYVQPNTEFDSGGVGTAYSVIWDNPDLKNFNGRVLGETHLRLHRETVYKSSWDVIRQLCGYSPYKIRR